MKWIAVLAFIGLALAQQAKKVEQPPSKSKTVEEEYGLPFYYDLAVKPTIEKMAKSNTTQEILDYIQTNPYGLDNSVYGYISVFEKMKEEKKLDQPELVNLAFNLRDSMGALNQSSKAYKSASLLKNNLPKSVRNLAFSKCVIIKRGGGKEEMYLPIDKYKRDKNRRYVFTWIPGRIADTKQSCWSVQREKPLKNRAYLIKNPNRKEYLYAAYNQFNVGKGKRSVFTWTPHSHDKQSRWIFEPVGEKMYVKNVLFGEYLTTDYYTKYDRNRRKVYTDISKKKSKKSLWVIANGDQFVKSG